MSIGLGREDIRALLDDLSAELRARGTRAELFLVGGAAMAVAYDSTRATRDLDAVFVPSDVVRQAAWTRCSSDTRNSGPMAYSPAKSLSMAADGYDDSDATPFASVTGKRAPSCWWLSSDGSVASIRSKPMKSSMLAGKSGSDWYAPVRCLGQGA